MKRITFSIIIFFMVLSANLFSYTVISNISPYTHISVTNGTIYQIQYYVYDSSVSNVFVTLFYNTSNSIIGATVINSNFVIPGTHFYNWDTTSIPQGTYWIIGQAAGSNNTNGYSADTITISNSTVTTDNPPTLSDISPLVSNQTVYSGSSYQIQFFIDDDNTTNMDVNFFYSPTTTAGTYITNQFYSAGNTNFYSWDTTGVPEGSYYIRIITSDSANHYVTNNSAFQVIIVNTNTNSGSTGNYTVISNISPYTHISVTNGEIYTINYFTDDSSFSNVTALLYYNTTASMSGATLICSNYTLIGSNYYNWDTTSVPQGTYWIIGQAFGSTNSPVSFSFNTITISNSTVTTDNPPTLSDISPIVSNQTVYSGSSYQIQFFIDDDNTTNMDVNFFYSPATTAGTYITNQFYSAGNTNFYSWDTTGVPEGSYYIRIITSDSANHYVTNNSAFQVIIVNTNTNSGSSGNYTVISNISPYTHISVTNGEIYTINYFTDDSSFSNVTALLYYNTTASMSGATLICSNYTLIGSNYYNWDTTSVPQGTYYIIGQAFGSTNSPVSFSFNTITISSSTSQSNTNNTTIDTTAPTIPTGLKITAHDKALFLHWNMNIEPDLKGYYIYRKKNNESTYKLINFVQYSNVYFDDNLENGKYYSYKLRAVDINDNISDFSASVGAMPVKIINNNDINLIFSDNKITPRDDETVKISISSTNSAYSGKITIYIYNVSMRLIKKIELPNLSREAAEILDWDLRDTNNIKVPTGVYFIWIVGKDWKKVKPIYVIR